MPYVTNRWLGGMLTNWRTIRQRINELDRLERMRDRGDFTRLPKKEVLILTRQMERLEMLIGGIRNINGLPDLLFVVDVRREDTAIHEANLLEIPVVALVDTNCDPRDVDYVIPSNDDAIRAIKLLVGKIADACLEGISMRKEEEEVLPRERMAAMAEEPELSDEELLGEATLAKIPSRGPDTEDIEEELDLEEDEDEEEEIEDLKDEDEEEEEEEEIEDLEDEDEEEEEEEFEDFDLDEDEEELEEYEGEDEEELDEEDDEFEDED
jgi:small subunit ribosomal protein S2